MAVPGPLFLKNAMIMNERMLNEAKLANERGIESFHAGRRRLAVDYFEQAVRLAPQSARYHYHLGLALFKNGEAEKSIPAFQNALELHPDDAETLNDLGNALKTVGDLDRALSCYRRAIEINPGQYKAYNNLGTLLQSAGNLDEAARSYRLAIEVNHHLADAHAGLAIIEEKKNRLDAARSHAEKALAIAPDSPYAVYISAKLDRRVNNLHQAREKLEALVELCDDPELLPLVFHELGLILDRAGEHREAFAAFKKANDVLREGPGCRNINGHSYLDSIDRLRNWAGLKDIRTGAAAGQDRRMNFLVGFPRSGTTLLEQILAAHSEMHTLDERPLIQEVIRKLPGGSDSYPEVLPSLTPAELEPLRKYYLARAEESKLASRKATFILDKFPLNIIDLPMIHLLFPNARIIVALRNPPDVCLSCFMQQFSLNQAMVHFLEMESTAILYAKVMDLWLHYEKVLPLDFLYVRYEDMVTDLQGEVGRVLNFLGLDWDERILQYRKAAKNKTISTPSYSQVTEKIYHRAVGRWKKYQPAIEPAFPYLEPFMEKFGYLPAPAGIVT